MSEIEGLRALTLSTEIGASLLQLPRRNREKYSGRAATVVTLLVMEAILRKCTPLQIWESNQEMTFLSMMMRGGFHFSMRMGAINTAEGFTRCCPEIIQASGVEALTLGYWVAFARVDRAPLTTRPIGDLPHYLFFITMHSMTRVIGPVHCLPAGIVEMVWDICEQEEMHIHAVARTLRAICPSALTGRFPPSMRKKTSHLPPGVRADTARGTSWGSTSTDLRKLVSMKETIGGVFPPISFGSFSSDLGISVISLKKSIIGTSPPAHVKKWLISPFDTSATSEDDISNMQAVRIAGLKVDDTEVTRDAVLVTFISKWEGPLAITAQVAKSQVRGDTYTVPGDRRSAIIRQGATLVLPAPADGEEDVFPAFGVDPETGNLTGVVTEGGPPLQSFVYYRLVSGGAPHSPEGFLDVLTTAAGTLFSVASPIIKAFTGGSPQAGAPRFIRCLLNEKGLPSGQALITPRPIKDLASNYYKSNFSTYSRDKTWIFATSYASDGANKAADRMITISLACAVFFRALHAEVCLWMLLLDGKELPGPAKDIHGRVPTLADDIEVRLVVDVSFAHGLATDPAVMGNDLPSLTPLDTLGVWSFEMSAKIPLVHIDGGPFVHLLPDGDATDFAAISLTLPIGLSFSSPLPERRYTSGKYVKYEYQKGANLAIFVVIVPRIEIKRLMQFNKISAQRAPGGLYITPTPFALHYSVPDEISFPGAWLSWRTFKDHLIAGGSYGDVRVTKMVRRAVFEDATSVATEGDIRGGMLLSGLDFEVDESVGANTPPVPTG